MGTTCGVALNGAAANQPPAVLVEGRILIGAAAAVGTISVQSDVAGGIRSAAIM